MSYVIDGDAGVLGHQEVDILVEEALAGRTSQLRGPAPVNVLNPGDGLHVGGVKNEFRLKRHGGGRCYLSRALCQGWPHLRGGYSVQLGIFNDLLSLRDRGSSLWGSGLRGLAVLS